MDYFLKFEGKKNEVQLSYTDKVMLIGSCFTEHIGNFLQEHKFNVLQNPNGILFDTLSVCRSLLSYIDATTIAPQQLFNYNELWQHWQFHSQYSHPTQSVAVAQMQQAITDANRFIKETDRLIITLGSSFAYKLKPEYIGEYNKEPFVSNCHKAPAQWFEKYLIPIDEQIAILDQTIYRLRKVNPTLKVIFTISPVRHIRDGVVENNRSKARLLETVHHLIQKFNDIYYFAAYELVIDVLRDYRFYDIDMVHPNYSATQYVIQSFCKSFINNDALQLLEAVKPIITAYKHRPFNPDSLAHKKFKLQQLDAIQQLQQTNPALDFSREMTFFSDVIV